jgi:phytol kinase
MTPETMIILGYVIFALWMPLMFIAGELLGKKTTLDKEVVRKIQHIFTSVGWLIGAIFFGPTIHIVIINFLGFVALTVATFSNKLNFTSRSDSKRSYGLMYFGLGTLIVIILGVYVVPELFYQTAIPYYCLAFADGLAPLIAKLFKNKNIKITKSKTLVGSLSVLIISFLVILIINSILKTNFDIWFMIALASLCAVLELFGKKGSDNLLIELGMIGLLILNHYNLINTPILISLITAPVILVLALIKKSITLPAAIMGLILSLSISFFIGDSVLFVILGLFFIRE